MPPSEAMSLAFRKTTASGRGGERPEARTRTPRSAPKTRLDPSELNPQSCAGLDVLRRVRCATVVRQVIRVADVGQKARIAADPEVWIASSAVVDRKIRALPTVNSARYGGRRGVTASIRRLDAGRSVATPRHSAALTSKHPPRPDDRHDNKLSGRLAQRAFVRPG